MVNAVSPTVRNFGFRAAVWASVLSISYDVFQLFEWLGWMGSGGGPENASTVMGLIILLTPSLFLGIAFMSMIISIHYVAAADKKIWSHTAIAFAVIYTTLISINYFIQLTLVVPHMLNGETDSIQFLLFKPFDSFLYSIDILGYSFMSLATLFTANVFTGNGREKTVSRFMLANGLILPFIALQNYYHPLIWLASLWGITFPGAAISYAILLKKMQVKEI